MTAPRATPTGETIGCTAGCEVSALFQVLGRSHMLDVLYVLARDSPDARRFVEIQNELGLSPNTLAARLKDLQAHGLVTRVAYNEIPPRVDYTATQKAIEFNEVFKTLRAWAERNNLDPVPDIQAPAATA